MNQTLLAIGKDPQLADEIRAASQNAQLDVVHVMSAAEAIYELRRGSIDLVLCSDRAQGEEGFDIVPQLRRQRENLTVAMITEGDAYESARDALSRGVSEVLRRPICPGALRLLVQRVRDQQDTARTARLLSRELRKSVGEHPIIAASPKMISVLEALERSRPGNAPKLLCGEPGSGRQSVARALHVQSAEGQGPFVTVQCSGREESQLETELFGSARLTPGGARGTHLGLLPENRGGTLYLAEIGDLPPRLQSRLALVLEAQETTSPTTGAVAQLDVQLVGSTHRDLAREAKSGRYDESLLSQFGQEVIAVPPLRERREDIPLLADALVRHLCNRHGRKVLGISDAALEALTRHNWPGNLHELENALDTATRLADGDKIDLPELPDGVQHDPNGATPNPWALRPARRRAEAVTIRRSLRSTGGNRTHAARLLGISQRALLYKIKDYDIRD